MDVLNKEAWPGRHVTKKGVHPQIIKAIASVIDGNVVRFQASDLKVLGLKNMLSIEQSLRRQANELDFKVSIANRVDPSTGMKEIYVRRADGL